jgi:stage V sporulation protein B
VTTQAAADASKGDQAATRAAGRGGLAIAVAKVSFILVGFIQQLVFPRILDEAGYGAVVRMLSVVSVVNNVVVAMSLQGVSRMVVQAKDDEKEQTVRTTLLVHTVIAIVVSTAFAILAGFIARKLEAPLAERPLRIAAGVVLCYGVYAPLVGALNGRKRFLDQAGLDIFYGISRTIAMTVAAWIFASVLGGDGTLGAAIGFVSAAVLIIPIAMWRSGIGKAGPGGPTTGEYLRFLLPVLFAQAGLNLFLQLDILMLSQAAGEYARVVGLDQKEADKLLGPYRAPQLFGFLPYQLLMSVQFVLFPLLAKASADLDTEGVKRLTRAGMRLAFVLTGLIAGTIGSLAPHLVRFAFPENIALQSAPFARVYTLGLSGLAILGVASAALASLRRERWSMVLTWVAAGLVALSIVTFQGEGTFGPELLRSTAHATALAMVVAATLGSIALYRAAGAFMPPLTLVRVLGAVAVVVAIGTRVPWMGKLMAPVLAIAMAVVYVVLLIVTGEVGRADLASIRAVVSRRKG